MNEAILNQILANSPQVMPDTAEKNDKLEALYHAVLTFYPEFAKTEVDQNATIGDIYALITDFFEEKEVNVALNQKEGILAPELSYEAVTGHAIYDLSLLPSLKEKNSFAYSVFLHCVAVLSHYCLNSLNHHEWWQENIEEWNLAEDDLEPEEKAYYLGAIELIKEYDELRKDYFNLNSKEESVKFLINIKNNKKYRHLSPKTKSLVFELLNRQAEWELFYQARNSQEDEDEGFILFTEYIGFGLPEISDCYDQHLHDHLQYAYENGTCRSEFIATVETKDTLNIGTLASVVDGFCGIVEATGITIQEVCTNAS